MGLGILEDRHLDPVPGTATLQDLQGNVENTRHLGKVIKRSADGIILVPQPSDSPDDPLNWPLWQRDLATLVLCLMSILASTLSPLMAANTVTLIQYFHGITVTQAALLTGWHVAGVAMSGFLFVASGRVWGKRHLFIIGPIIMFAATLWGGLSGHHYKSLVAARVFQGVGLAPFEGLVNAAVGELYFVHESGSRLAMTNMCLFGTNFLTPVLVGKITLTLGWQWSFYFIAIFMFVLYPFVVLFCPETAFVRDAYYRQNGATMGVDGHDISVVPGSATSSEDITNEKNVTVVDETEKNSNSSTEINPAPTLATETPAEQQVNVTWKPVERKLITRKSLALFNGRKTHENFWKICVRPFPLFFHSGILWSCLIQGSMIAWSTFLGVTLAITLLALGFNEAQSGYMYAGAFVGAVIAFTLAGVVSDPLAKWLTRLNKGIFEPEFRIILVLPMALIGIPGLFAYGYFSEHVKEFGWPPLAVFFGFFVFALTLGAVVSAQYIVDGYRNIAVEGFTCLLVFKNIWIFLLTYKGFDWLLKDGAKKIFFIFGYVQIGITVLSVIMWITGKKQRSFWWRHSILKMLWLD